MAGRYTVADLDKAYENRKKNNENNSTQRNTSRSNVSSSSADRVNNYTVADLEQAYQRQYGQNVSQQQTQTRVPFADHTKTAQEIAADKLREYSSREPVEQFDTMNPDSEQMRAFRSARMSADPTRTSTSTPTSPWLIKQMDDEAINEAIDLLTQRRAQTENEYMNTWDTNENAQSLLDQMDEDAETIERYKEELETRETTRQTEEIEAYQQKRIDSLDELPEEAVELLNQYNQSIQNRESLQMTGTVTGYVDPMEIVRYDTAMQDARDKLINEYGVAESDIERLAQYEKELSDEEDTQNMRQQIREDIAEHPVGYGALYTGMDIIMSPLTGLAATTESIKSRYYADQDAPINTNSGAYAALNFSNATEQSVNEEIDNPVGQFAYNVATSTAKSAFSAAIGGQVTKTLGLTGKAAEVVGNAVTLPQFGATAYASTLQEDQERGISTENATKHAVAAGVGEMLFEVVSLDKVWEIAGRSGKVTAQQVIKDTLIQAGIEGTEEGMTDLWDRVADDIINGDQSAYNTNVQNYMQMGYTEEEAKAQASKDFYSEVVQDVLAGMASGGLTSGGANTVAAVNYHNLGNYVDSNAEVKQTVYDAAQNMDASSSARQIVQDKSVEDLSASDMADLLYTMSQETEMDTAKVLEDAFVARGESRTQAKKDAQTVLEAVSTPSENVSEEESDARAAQFAANENLAEVYAETLKGEHTRAQDAIRTAQESYETSKYYDKLVRQGKTSQTGVAKATIKDTGTDAIVIELADVSGGKAVVRMSDNTYKNLDDIEIQDGIKQSLYNFATTMDTAQAGNAIIENYAGESLPSYMEACAVFYNAGKLGSTSFDGMMSNPKNSKLVSNMSNPATLKTMYMLGENSRSAKKDKVAPVQQKKNSKTEQNKKTAETRKEGKVIDNRTNKSDNRIVEIAVQVAKKTGLEITLNDNLEHGENGHFQKALSRIALSSASKNEYATLVHELNEFAEAYNPEGMKMVIDKVLDYAQTQEGAAFLFGKESGFVQRYQNAYKRVEADKTYEDAAEEFVFDYLSGVFSSKEGVEDFSRYMTETGVTQKEQKGILETIADFFKELADKINSYLDEHVLSSAAKKGLQADAKKAREIRQMVMEVWQQAEKNYRSGEDTTFEETKKFSFGGQYAQTADIDGMTKAVLLEENGVSEEQIFKETGWFRGADRRWRFEIDDSKARVYYKGDALLAKAPEYAELKELGEKLMETSIPDEEYAEIWEKYGQLEEKIKNKMSEPQDTIAHFLEHEELFKAYPYIANVRVEKSDMAGLRGSYSPSTNTVHLDRLLLSEYTEAPLKKTLLHEIQHIIQHHERFAGGANEETWNGITIKKNQHKYERAMKQSREAFKGGNEEFRNLIRSLNRKQINEEFDEEYDRIENELMEKYETRYFQYDNAMFEARLYKDSEELSNILKYKMTAGEVEARDVAARADMTVKERQEKMPVRETENGVIFAENPANPFEVPKVIVNNGASYSIGEIWGKKDSYGIGVILDTNLFAGVKSRKWSEVIRNYVYNNLAGTELTVYNNNTPETIYLAKKNERVIKDGANNSHRVIDKLARNRSGDNIRNLSIVHIDELAKVSNYVDENSEHVHQWLDEKGWEFRTAYAKSMDGRIYKMTLNIGKSRDGRKILYDINNIKEIDHGDVASKGRAHKNQSLNKSKTRNNTDVNKKYSINVTEMTSEDDSMLKEYFGTTKNYNMAGYILKDGSMLDFSGRHWGDTSSRVRQVDHRDINEVLDEENYGDAMINAIANGNIRLMSETGGINLAVTPTRKQEDVLRGYISSFHGAVIVDFDEKGGDTVKSLVYDRGTEADDVLDDIYNYFRGGTQSELMRFHAQYSIEVDEDGIENYITSEETKVLSHQERKRKLLDIMKNEYAGRTAKFVKNGKVYYALYDETGINKGVYGDKKSSKRGYRAKINIGADGNYIELAENALYQSSKKEIGKSNRFHRDAQTWDYYAKTIKSDGRYYDVLINVKDTGNGKYVYDITLKEAASLPDSRGSYDGSSTASSNRIPQNEKKSTKKYSIDIDDSLFDALQETYSTQEQETASIIQEGFASLKKVTVDEKVMHRIAYDIKKAYKSNYSIEKLEENLTRVFAYLKDHADSVGYEDMVRIVQEIAKPVIQESTDIDSFEKEIYDNFRNHLRSYTIRLSEEQKAEVAYYYGSYENFRKKNFGNLNFSDKGTYLDNIWSEICDHSYEMLDRSVSTADEPIALIDTLNALRPVKKNIYGMDTEQASYDLALDIYRRFFVEQGETRANQKIYEKTQRLIVRQQEYRKRVKGEYDASLQRLREVEQQKRKNLAEKYEQKIADLKEDQKAMLAYKDVKAHNAAQRQMDWYTAALAKTNQRANDRILEIRASNRQSMINKRRNEEIRQCRERIKKNAQGIVNMFNTNTDKKHVPEVLKEPVARFITSIDFVSERANPDSAATLSWQDALNQMYRKLSDRKSAVDGGYIELYEALHDWENGDKKTSTILSDMAAFIDSNSGVKVSEMNIEQLKQLDEMITGLKRTIASVNQLYVNKRTKNVQELANGTIGDLSDKKSKKSRSKIGEMAENLLDVDMLDARSYFYRLGDNAYSIYEELRTAFSDRVWLLKEAQTYMEKTLDGIDVKSWTGDKAKVHSFMIGGQELKMTTGQIMSLYELKNRYQAKAHLRHGGIRPTKIGRGKKGIERVTPVKLTDYEIDLICQVLTPEQRKVADAMQQFLANNCADWGNKASMMMYGYERFGAANYFPIKTDGNSVDTRDDTKFFATKNQGFTKETMKNAGNAVMVDDIFDVFTKHVTDMASYSTFTAPLMDAMKWFNHRSMDHEGDAVIYGPSVKQEIDRVYGNQYLEYFKKLIQDINAETTKGIESQISDTLTSRMKVASVGANLRVAIQQPTAYVRAMAVMNPKYLLKAVPHKSQIKKAKENSAIAQWKSWGYFETSIGQSMKNVITGQDSFKNKVVEKSMILAQIGDDITWGYLWNACEAEIKEKHPNVEYDSQEFLKLVSERFDEVVDQTQVVDTVLHRSHIMRSNDRLVKMEMAFMAEPTKTYNMLMTQIRDIKEGGGVAAKKRLARATIAYVVNGLMNAFAVSLIDAMRDDDDDDSTYSERYWEAWKENVIDNLNPLGMIPYVKDILSIFGGYDVARTDMQGISYLITGGQMLRKYIEDPEYREKHTLLDTSKMLINGASQVLGLPLYNCLREFEAIFNTFTGEHLGGIIRSNGRNYERMTDALLEGDAEKYEDALGELEEKEIETKDIESGVRNEVKDRYLIGEISKEDAEDILREAGGLDANETYWKIRDWEYRANNPDASSSDYKYLYDAMDNAFESGKIDDRDAMVEEISLLLNHGKTTETVMRQVTDHYKPIYLELKAAGSYADMKNLLISAYMMLGLSKSEAMEKIEGWEEEK